MMRKANYKPTLPIFGERFLEKSVKFQEEDYDLQQYDSLYDDNMKDYFNKPKIKKRLFKLGLTDSDGNAIGSKGQERSAIKKKQLLKEREEIVKKIRTREADRIARLATNSNGVTKFCVACNTHDRILSYLKSHMCPIHSNVTYQRAKDTLKNSLAHDVLSSEDNLAKLEVENRTLKNLWYSEVLRMEEEALQQQLKYEKSRLQQVHLELKNLKQQKEATETESLELIKINLYSKIKRRLGLQALLTTLREVDGGPNTSLFDKVAQDVNTDVYDWYPPCQLNRQELSFQYLPQPHPPARVSQDYGQVSVPVGSQQVTSNSNLSLHQSSSQFDEQLKKRPSSSRGYRTVDNRGPYSRTTNNSKQTASISPLVNSTSASMAGIPQQLSNTLRSNSDLVDQLSINADVDDDTMPLEEAETLLESYPDVESSSSLDVCSSDVPMAIIRDKIQPRRQAFSVTAESALTPRPIIPIRRSIPTMPASKKHSTEKRVNFMIDPEPTPSHSAVGNAINRIIQNAKEQCEVMENEVEHIDVVDIADTKAATSVDITDDPSKTTADTTIAESDPNSISDPANEKITDNKSDPNSISDPANEKITDNKSDPNSIPGPANEKITDNKNSHRPQTASHLNTNADNGQKVDSSPQETEDLDPTMEEPADIDPVMKELLDIDPTLKEKLKGETVTPSTNKPILSKKTSKLSVKSSSSSKTAQVKGVTSSAKKVGAKNSKQFDPVSSKVKQNATKQLAGKQTTKKPKKVAEDWKKTVLQNVKK